MAAAPTSYEVIVLCDANTKHKMTLKQARMCGTIANMLDDIDDESDVPIPIPNVKGEIFEKVIAFCKKYEDMKLITTEEEDLEMRVKPLEGWDKDYVNVPLAVLFEMILAANFLDLKHMLNLTCKSVAEMIKGKTPTEIKKVFGIEGDFTDVEREHVIRDNPWLLESGATPGDVDPEIPSSGGAPAPQSSGGAPAPPSSGGAPAP
tara:strand:+ start:677 stop:1291 length:615 start_codon:yes stop_codon:yes gene_type:complete